MAEEQEILSFRNEFEGVGKDWQNKKYCHSVAKRRNLSLRCKYYQLAVFMPVMVNSPMNKRFLRFATE